MSNSRDDRINPISTPSVPQGENQGSVLLLGNYRPTLSLARSLNHAGHRIIVGIGGGEGYGEYSSSVSEAWQHPSLSDEPEAFFDELCAFLLNRPDIQYLFPVAEEFLIALSAKRSRLPEPVTCVMPDYETIERCSDKVGLLTLAGKLGISNPAFCAVRSDGDILAAARDIGFPLIVRPLPPLRRVAEKKALSLSSADEVISFQRQLGSRADERLLLQKRFEGERQDIIFAAQNGKILRALQVRYLRTDQIDGTGLCVYGEVIALSDPLLEATRRLAKSLGYNGIGCTQFIVDQETSGVCLLELNPRTSAIHHVAEAMQMALARTAIEIADGSASSSAFDYKPGLTFAWSYGELRAIKSALRNKEISIGHAIGWAGSMLRSAATSDVHLTWNLRDFKPTTMLFARQLAPAIISRSPIQKDYSNVANSAITWKVHADLVTPAEHWAHLEKTGVLTPFQRQAWLKAYLETTGKGDQPSIVVGFQSGQPIAVFPLAINQRFGVKRLEWLGQDYSDYNAPLCDRQWLEGLTKTDGNIIWRSICQAIGGVDVSHLAKQPAFIDDVENVFVPDLATPEAAKSHLATLETDPDTFYKSKFSKGTLRRLREKERRLSRHGNVEFVQLTDRDAKPKLTETILAWKSSQLDGQGARNPFATDSSRRFLVEAARNSDDVRVYVLSVDSVPLAGIVTLETADGPLIYQMAYAMGEHSRCSPGRLLLNQLINHCISRGDQMIDFSTGDETYKVAICDQHSPLLRTISGHTFAGKIVAFPLYAKLWLKCQIKLRPGMMTFLQSANRKVSVLKSLLNHRLLSQPQHNVTVGRQ